MVRSKSRMLSWLSDTSREATSPTRASLPPYGSLAPEEPSTAFPASPIDLELSPTGNASARSAEMEPSFLSPQSDHNDFPRSNNVWLHPGSSKFQKKTHMSAKPLSSVNKYALKRMLWPFVVGIVFALAQELFIRQAAGKYVQTYAIPEFWMRAIANVLASLAQFFFLAAMTTAIHQMIWWFIRRKRSFMIAQLNVLFSQPSSYLSLTSYPRILTDLPALTVILLSVTIIQLTNIFGPAALQTIPASPRIVSLPIPSMAWSDWTDGQAVSIDGSSQEVFTGPSLAWTNLVRSSLMMDRAVVASTSSGCQSGCSYDLTYAGPALSCGPEESSTLPSNTFFAGTFDRGQLNVTWASSSTGAASGAMSSKCFFTQGDYTNAVHLEGANTYSKVDLVNTGELIAPAWPMQLSTPVQARNFASVISAFGNSLAGTVTRDIDSGVLSSTTFATSIALLAINDSILPSTFKIAKSASSNVPTFLEDLFANVTSAFLGLQSAQQSIQVAILPAPGATVYVVRTMVLRLTYLISGSMTLISCILGYICLRRNQVVRRNCFSAFMEATYVPELGEVAQLAKDNRSRFYTSKLVFSPTSGAFTPAPSSR